MQSKEKTQSSLNTTNSNILVAINDSQLLLEHVAEKGILIDEKDISVLVNSKFSYEAGQWNPELETAFWRSMTNVTHIVKPVTIQSISSVKPRYKNGKRLSSDADKAVLHYRTLAVFSLVILLIVQIYLIVGISTQSKSTELFNKKGEIEAKIQEVKTLKNLNEKNEGVDSDVKLLQTHYKEIEQKQDANYELLTSWNNIWLTLLGKDKFEGKIREFREIEYQTKNESWKKQIEIQEKKLKQLESGSQQADSQQADSQQADKQVIYEIRQKIINLNQELKESQLQQKSDTTRNRFFLNTFAAEYAITAIEKYILPLLYGLLGAVFFVLRTLSREVQNLTYYPNREINYRLRIPTGALAGLTISWFITSDTQAGIAVSGFAISFLTGYNVELLFATMDRIIAQFTSKSANPKSAESQTQTNEVFQKT